MFQLGLSRPLPYTNAGQGLYHLLGVVEFCGSDFKYVLGVLCKYNDLPIVGIRTKAMSFVFAFFFAEGIINLNFCGK